VAALASAGLVDDARLARRRAEALAGAGWGDAAVEARLARDGVGRQDVRAALAELEPERERAARLVQGLEDPRAAWRLLMRRGFGEDAIEDAVGVLDARR
jgi:SOS response regulatory protein OraA/RecX